MQLFPWNCIYLLTRTQGKEFEDMFLVKIASKGTSLSCLKSGVDYSRFIGNDTGEELLTPLFGQLKFWCESGINVLLFE